MSAGLKTKWLEALRGGKYRQAREQLVDSGAFCCLGVLADVRGYKWPERIDDVEGVCDYYPPQVADLMDEATSSRLALMNDEGKSFAEIADYIEANVTLSEGHHEQ